MSKRARRLMPYAGFWLMAACAIIICTAVALGGHVWLWEVCTWQGTLLVWAWLASWLLAGRIRDARDR